MVAGYVPPWENKKKLIYESRRHLWDVPYLYRACADGLLRRCVPTAEGMRIFEKCHVAPYGGHYGVYRTQANIWQSGFFWPPMYEDTKDFIQRCQRCQQHGAITLQDDDGKILKVNGHRLKIFLEPDYKEYDVINFIEET